MDVPSYIDSYFGGGSHRHGSRGGLLTVNVSRCPAMCRKSESDRVACLGDAMRRVRTFAASHRRRL